MKTLLYVHHIDDEAAHAQSIIDLAANENLHLDLVVLGVLPTIAVYGTPGAAGFYYDGLDQEVIDSTKESVAELSKLVSDTGISCSVSMECREYASIGSTIQNHAMLADFVAFRHDVALAGDERSQAFNGALLGSGRPVVKTAADGVALPAFKKVLLAWNGQIEAARAMHQLVALCESGAEVRVVVVDPHEAAMGPNPGDDAAAFLARNGFKVTVDRLALGDRGVSDVLIEKAGDMEADVVFMGAYGKSRFREWLLGGTTREMLQSCKLPTVMTN